MLLPEESALEVAVVRGQSVLTTCRSVQPLKILQPRSAARACHAVLSSYGGGLVSGDAIRLRVGVGEEAQLFLGTQANARVYKAVGMQETLQHTTGALAENALAVVFPDPLVPQAGSRYRQQQHWQLQAGAVLLLADWFHAGRTDSGERFAFTSLHTALRVERLGKLTLLDRFQFQPEEHIAASPAHFGPYQTMLSLYLVGPPNDPRFRRLAEALLALQLPERRDPHFTLATRPYVISVAPAREDVYVLRALGLSRADLQPLCEELMRALASPELLGFNPWARKF
ncbi:urease accessory protein UreD [Hymenobacter sp. BT507]|uniref:Urease accessory protein UreD n=1 Tax=Hymenobacter citatus TaxID=2763506 RepID=A0ABR7MMR5_9BACT|nr:urease accessory protein UreD [Hymenobacter citatus]MBC6612243.1 urease accessory protein UreD [Hymenobacter citatus]